MIKKKTQADHVTEMLGNRPEVVVERVSMPGIEELHLKHFDEIAECLTTIVKSRDNIVQLKWVIGEKIELTVKI
jgi:hypothetical protein